LQGCDADVATGAAHGDADQGDIVVAGRVARACDAEVESLAGGGVGVDAHDDAHAVRSVERDTTEATEVERPLVDKATVVDEFEVVAREGAHVHAAARGGVVHRAISSSP